MGYTKIEIDASYVPRAGDVIVQRNNGDGDEVYFMELFSKSFSVKGFCHEWPSTDYFIRRPVPVTTEGSQNRCSAEPPINRCGGCRRLIQPTELTFFDAISQMRCLKCWMEAQSSPTLEEVRDAGD